MKALLPFIAFGAIVCMCTQTSGQVLFQADRTEGCAPLVVSFTSEHTDAVAWKWDFGNGNTSDKESPALIYDTAGSYHVKLIVTFSDGSMDSLIRNDYISVIDAPTVELSFDRNEICQGGEIQFSDESIDNSGIRNWYWDFGDGNTSQDANPSHVFQHAGSYTISLLVTNTGGCSGFAVKANAIEVLPQLDATFYVDELTACLAPLTVGFTPFPGSETATHFWDLGDGTTTTEPQPTHTYLQEGQFSVTHTVVWNIGCGDTLIQSNFISIGVDNIELVNVPSEICALEELTLTTNAGNSATVIWDLGDGSSPIAGEEIQANYPVPGTYTLRADVALPNGCSKSLNQTITVLASPTASFSIVDSISCRVPFAASFQNQSIDATSYVWDLGDGSQSNETNPNHAYGQFGSFSVRLTAFNAIGCSHSITKDDGVQISKIGGDFLADTLLGCAPLSVGFSPNMTPVIPITTWTWDFGDGASSTSQAPSHTYADSGNYTVRLIIENIEGCQDTLVKNNYITLGIPPVISFSTPDTSAPCVANNFQVVNTSSHGDEISWSIGSGFESNTWDPVFVPDGPGRYDATVTISDRGCSSKATIPDFIFIPPLAADFEPDNYESCSLPFTVNFIDRSQGAESYLWEFGNGDSSVLSNPSYTFTEEGSYRVKLSITTSQNPCVNETFREIRVYEIDAGFAMNTSYGCNPLVVEFEDMSHGATAWIWDFGNGNISDRQNPVEIFSPGTYDVSLRVENELGCSDTMVVQDLVRVIGPFVDFAADTLTGCAPMDIQFTSDIRLASGTTSIMWDFGDGNVSTDMNPVHHYDTAGTYTVSLAVGDASGCQVSETKDQLLFISDPIAAFELPHAQSCKESEFVFFNGSEGDALSYAWDFGDGTTDSSRNPTHQYAANGRYDIRLEITDINGCKDTLFRPELITIADLAAIIEVSDTVADCPPLLVNFRTLNPPSDQIIDWFWDFGDGSFSDLSNPSHVYSQGGVFDVGLRVEDALGCRDTVSLLGQIQIEGPSGEFEFTPREACPGTEIVFKGSAEKAISYTWDLGEGTVLLGDSVSHVFETPGIFFPKMLLDNGEGCVVVIPAPYPLEIFTPPSVEITIIDTISCINEEVFFSIESLGEEEITEWVWTFSNGTVLNGAEVSHVFSQQGNYDVSLYLEDVNGCITDLFFPHALEIVNRVVPVAPGLISVSVKANTQAEILFSKFPNQNQDFEKYHIYRSDDGISFTPIADIGEIHDTLFVDHDTDSRNLSYCYKVQVENICGDLSDLASYPQHCSIELQAIPQEESIHLLWNDYEGWQPDVYNIYRVASYDHHQDEFLRQVPGGSTSYVDREMDCDTPFSYRIEAQGANRQIISWSDTSFAAPIHQSPLELSHMNVASVLADSVISIEWEMPQMEGLTEMVIEKNYRGGFQEIFRQGAYEPTQSLIDAWVQVDDTFYQYRIFALDTCGDPTLAGRIATSIQLRADFVAGKTVLDWNPYEAWENGVEKYELEVWNDELHSFQRVGEVPGAELRFIDQNTELPQAVFCYRLRAHAEGNIYESLSNVVCVKVPAIIYAPNAFSPNGDGKNDEFRLKGHLFKSGSYEIFNRWGQLMHRANSLDEPWDGKLPNGNQAPEGVYVFVGTVIGYDDLAYERKGTVTLIR